MERLQLTCEVVTPLFCAGADQRHAEIRAPSIRGAMRFWYRALVGAVVRENLKALQQRESGVFGATERASAVNIRVHASELPMAPFEFRDPSLRYLGFGLFRTQDGFPRSYVPPGTKFGIELVSSNRHALDEAAAALWLLLNLGGLGARARRGWGSLRVMAETGTNVLKFVLPYGPGFKSGLEAMSRLAVQTIVPEQLATAGDDRRMPSYPTLLPGYWRMRLVQTNEQRQPFRTWDEALIWAGQCLRRFREDPNSPLHTRTTPSGRTFRYKVGRDYRQVKKIFAPTAEGNIGPLRLPIFGLPVQYRFQSEGNQSASVGSEQHDRRGSPLWVRAYRGDSGFLLGFMLFTAQFLPDEELLMIKGAGKTLTAPQPDYALLEEFLNRLPGEEITL